MFRFEVLLWRWPYGAIRIKLFPTGYYVTMELGTCAARMDGWVIWAAEEEKERVP